MLCELPDLGRHLCLWVYKDRPPRVLKPSELLYQSFGPESEHTIASVADVTLIANEGRP